MELPTNDVQSLETEIEKAHAQYCVHLRELVSRVQHHITHTHQHSPMHELDEIILNLKNIPYINMKNFYHRFVSVCESNCADVNVLVALIREICIEFKAVLPANSHRQRRDKEALKLQQAIMGKQPKPNK